MGDRRCGAKGLGSCLAVLYGQVLMVTPPTKLEPE